MKELEALKAILYFSIFKHPINKKEVFKYANVSNKLDLNEEIDFLIKKGIIYKIDGFYSSVNDLSLVKRRITGNLMAEQIMPKACKVGRFITKFPFVESVSLSGALSKGYYDNDGDIDFFIITKPNKLWIARTLLILYKKIFLLNSKKYFCVNYFISSESLEISERNRFTATEISTLIPISGEDVFLEFIDKNKWVNEYFPNKPSLEINLVQDVKKPLFSKLLEVFFNGFLGNYFDHIFRRITIKKWQSKFNHLEKKDFEIAMKSTKGVSKHHPQNFQKKVIEKLNEDFKDIQKKYNLELPLEHA